MSTKGRIGIVKSDGTVESVYCSHECYPSGVGATLLAHYTDPKKVKQLIALGDIAYLRKNIFPDSSGGQYRDNYEDPNSPVRDARGRHCYDYPQIDVVVALYRDRGGEDWWKFEPEIHDSLSKFLTSEMEEYGYVMVDGKWYIIFSYYFNTRKKDGDDKLVVMELTDEICKMGDEDCCEWYESVCSDTPEDDAIDKYLTRANGFKRIQIHTGKKTNKRK